MTTDLRNRRILGAMVSSRARLWTIVGGLLAGALATNVAAQGGAPLDRPAPEVGGAPWINSSPLTTAALRGRVIFVEFWTYG